MKVIDLAHLDKFFTIKSTTGQDALEGSSDSAPVLEEETQASENVDLATAEPETPQPTETTSENNNTEETSLASKEMMMMVIKLNSKDK